MKARESAGYMLEADEGASPFFPPEHATAAEAKAALLHVVRRAPETYGYLNSRWRLDQLRDQVAWLHTCSQGGICRLLKRLGISYKRGRDYVHSPDRHYWPKLHQIEQCRLRAYYAPQRYVFLYEDEFTYYRQPSPARAYEAKGPTQPLARRSHRRNTPFRTVATLDALTGAVCYRQRSKLNRFQLSAFYADVCKAYPDAEVIYMVIDNWPVHFHPDLLARLNRQRYLHWPRPLPSNWPTEPGPRAVHDDLPIQLLPLPTYASWLNPIEKLWRWLKQDIIHLHALSDQWQTLKQRIALFLDQFRHGSDRLLRYVGLLPP